MEMPSIDRLRRRGPHRSISPRQEVDTPERELRLETPMQRALEASLFIDKKFLDVSVITGSDTAPELLFGEKAWNGYVNARNHARQHGSKILSVEFIGELHSKITESVDPQIAGKIRAVTARAGNYNNPNEPVEYSEEEIEIIKQNPYLIFEEAGEKNKGFIHYPFTKDGVNAAEYIQNLLQEICDWYNIENGKPDSDPYELAAILQRKLISVHPFHDANGTTSRVLMNWALEAKGLSPSALDNPSSDILTSESSWIEEVKKGSLKYTDSQKRVRALELAGIKDIAYAIGLSPEKAFYDYVFRYICKPPRFFSNQGMQDHQSFESFFTQFIAELKEFQKFLQSETKIGEKTVTQGGLISDGFIKFLSRPGFVPKETADLFLSDADIFRGGSLDVEEIDDMTICQLMGNYTGVGTGYRALKRSYMSALSGDIASKQQITESTQYYNKIMAKFYLARKHPEILPYGSEVKDLDQTVRAHTGGTSAMWDYSPFASTSFSRQISLGFAGGLAKYGVLFTAKAPSEGMVLSFTPEGNADGLGVNELGLGSEEEGLVAGGLNPNSIQEIRIYKGRGRGTPASFIAEQSNGEIIISDLTGKFVSRRTYKIDVLTGQYILIGEEQTDVLSSELDRTSPQEESVLLKPYTFPKPTFQIFDLGTDFQNIDIPGYSQKVSKNEPSISKYISKKYHIVELKEKTYPDLLINNSIKISTEKLPINIYPANIGFLEKKPGW